MEIPYTVAARPDTGVNNSKLSVVGEGLALTATFEWIVPGR